MIKSLLAIFIGGGLGSLLRYGIGVLYRNYELPWGTLVANALSCILLGIFVGWMEASDWMTARLRLFLITGLCGGFSTFSTFSYQTFKLWNNGEHLAAIANIGGSVLVCVFCILLGIKIVSFLT
ncbi:MAG: fluoride efflux transporter CrcB [Saprospiraceae bacterium]|nr:fluoride efflux transporter CrcB [Saprospiraceae bacterium]